MCSISVKNTICSLIGIAVLLECGELFTTPNKWPNQNRVLVRKPCIIIRAVVSSDTDGKTTNIPN